ncbi:MAG: hypothetical protein AUK44_05890 [Porphyromonadaceae bacterium CG2_30_38_12]|nr:MAG: hypothetical protein AUK44_05890 [Porphyromonadaceae bacterium CG2_30_38_12]
MKTFKRYLLLTFAILLTTIQAYAQLLPPDPGSGASGGGASVPLDGGILLALLSIGTGAFAFFFKKKKKDL